MSYKIGGVNTVECTITRIIGVSQPENFLYRDYL